MDCTRQRTSLVCSCGFFGQRSFCCFLWSFSAIPAHTSKAESKQIPDSAFHSCTLYNYLKASYPPPESHKPRREWRLHPKLAVHILPFVSVSSICFQTLFHSNEAACLGNGFDSPPWPHDLRLLQANSSPLSDLPGILEPWTPSCKENILLSWEWRRVSRNPQSQAQEYLLLPGSLVPPPAAPSNTSHQVRWQSPDKRPQPRRLSDDSCGGMHSPGATPCPMPLLGHFSSKWMQLLNFSLQSVLPWLWVSGEAEWVVFWFSAWRKWSTSKDTFLMWCVLCLQLCLAVMSSDSRKRHCSWQGLWRRYSATPRGHAIRENAPTKTCRNFLPALWIPASMKPARGQTQFQAAPGNEAAAVTR